MAALSRLSGSGHSRPHAKRIGRGYFPKLR